MSVKCSLVIIGMLILVFIVLLYINNKVKKHKQRTKRIFSLVIVSILTFLFILQIVFIALLSAPTDLVEDFPFLFNVNEQSFGWISIWLAVLDIILSSITAIVAIIISLRQDDITQLEFKNSLIPRIKEDGFKSNVIKKDDWLWDLTQNKLCIKETEKFFRDEIYILDFQLLEELNPSIEYEIYDFKLYKGFVGANAINENCLFSTDNETVNVFLEQKQKHGEWVLEILLAFKKSVLLNQETNKFLSNLFSSVSKEDESKYTLVLNLKIMPKLYEKKNFRELSLTIQLLNEAAATGNINKDSFYSVYAVENKII